MNQNSIKLTILLLLITLISGIELQLSPNANMETCTILMSTFDPVNVQIRLPIIPDILQQEAFGIRVNKMTDYAHQNYVQIAHNTTYRNSYTLDSNVPYQLCVTFNTVRNMDTLKPIYVNYMAAEDFQSLIGRVEVPSELASQENLKTIYHLASKLNQVSSVIITHQVKERKLQDQIVTRNIHKEKRIILFSIVEILIIILCGVYQIFALRKFLIEKNLY